MSVQGEPVTQGEPPNLELPVNLNNFPPRVDDPRRREALDEPWKPGEKRRYGIQFREPLTEKQFNDLKQHFRFSPDCYIPESVYVQLLDQETLVRLKNHPLVNAAFRLEGKYKISNGIGKLDVKSDERKRILPDRLLWVVLFPEAEPDEMAKELERLGATETRVVDDRNWGGVARIELRLSSLDLLPAIAAIESVRWIEEVPEVSSSAGVPNGVLESGQPDFTPISDAGLHANNEIIGVLDEGILDVCHCWFDDNGQPPGPGHRKVVNQRSQNGLSPISPHAAFVVGILCGHNITSPGTVPDRGIAWEAKVTYSDRLDIKDGKATLVDYLELATHDGACIHQNSWHVQQPADTYHPIEEDIDRFAWTHEDCLVVAASGNADEVNGPPATAKNALSVSAAYVCSKPAASCFGDGTTGPTFDGRRKPDLLAPGCAIESALAQSGCCVDLDENVFEESFPRPTCAATELVRCYTSFAAPVASAAAAIVRQYYLQGRYPTGKPVSASLTPSGALLKATLLNATRKSTCSSTYPSDQEGWGLLRLNRVLHLGTGRRKLFVHDRRNTNGLRTEGAQSFNVEVLSDTEPLTVTLVWTEPDACVLTTNAVVNNLDLAVRSPGNRELYLGNDFAGGVSAKAGPQVSQKPDKVNNVELVLVPKPTKGIWKIAVTAKEVNPLKSPTGQGFALVVSGELKIQP